MRPSVQTCCLLVLIAGAAMAAETVLVDAAVTVRAPAGNPVGLNLNYLMDDDALRPTGGHRTLTTAIGDLRARVLRYPGGEKSDNYLWTTAAGSSAPITRADAVPSPLRPHVVTRSAWPGDDATLTDAGGAFVAPILDFDEFIALCRANGCEPVVVVPYDRASEITGEAGAPTVAQLVESAAAWVRYANVTRGYRVRYWEIGNESFYRSGQTAAIYAGHVNQFAAAMRGVDGTIRIGAHGLGATWWATLLADAGPACDWLAVHDYPCHQWATGFDVFRTSAVDLTSEVDLAIAAIGAGSQTVGITETSTMEWDAGGWANLNDTGHALVQFDLVGQQLLKPKVAFTQSWNSRWINNVAYAAGTGANSVGNPGFEDDLAGWSGSGGSISVATVHAGGKALQAVGGTYHERPLVLQTGRSYVLKGWSSTSTTAIWSGFGVDFRDGLGVKISGISLTATTTASWGEGVRPFTVPAGAASTVVWVYVAPGAATTCFDDLAVIDEVVPEVHDAFTPDNGFQPIGRALAIWGQFMPERLVQATGSASVIAYAGTSASPGQPLVVWLCNRQTSAVAVSLEVAGFAHGGSAARWTFQGTAPEDCQPTWTADAPLAVAGASIPLTLPRLSITVLRLAAAGSASGGSGGGGGGGGCGSGSGLGVAAGLLLSVGLAGGGWRRVRRPEPDRRRPADRA